MILLRQYTSEVEVLSSGASTGDRKGNVCIFISENGKNQEAGVDKKPINIKNGIKQSKFNTLLS